MSLAGLEKAGLFDGPLFSKLERKDIFNRATLNDFMALGNDYWHEVRVTLQKLFSNDCDTLKNNEDLKKQVLTNVADAKMVMPVFIRDYTDFYSSYNHAYNVGHMIRGPDNAIQPNWMHLPVGYHGRASSVVISGTEIRRPKGQVSADKINPKWSRCNRLDFELEMGAFVGKGNEMGKPIKVNEAGNHIFGFSILNDWSARDLQVWEYVPLGPFNAKNFGSTLSPWIIAREALEQFKVTLDAQDPAPQEYLKESDHYSYDINLEVKLTTPQMKEPFTLSESNFKHLYWSVNQQLAHHAVTGCNMNVGDLLGSGTISGKEKKAYGSLLELCWGGKEPIELPNGEKRTFLEDGDTVIMTGFCQGNGFRVGFGECTGTILPALEDSDYF